jgi:hypothetical protein
MTDASIGKKPKMRLSRHPKKIGNAIIFASIVITTGNPHFQAG